MESPIVISNFKKSFLKALCTILKFEKKFFSVAKRMAQWVKAFATKPNDRGPFLEAAWWKERTSSSRWASALHGHAWHVGSPTQNKWINVKTYEINVIQMIAFLRCFSKVAAFVIIAR